jgi:hypothetical protein
MHAGINPAKRPKSIAAMNDQVRSEVRKLDAYRKRLTDRRLGLEFFGLQDLIDVSVVELTVANEAIATAKAEGKEASVDLPLLREAQNILEIPKWSVVDPEGPLWFRGYATLAEDATAAQVNAFLDQMKLARIVIGHTPTTTRRIVARYGGRVVLIDTGILVTHYKGVPSALEIVAGKMKAIYPDEDVDLTIAPKAAAKLSPRDTPSSMRTSKPDALATAKLKPVRFRSGGTPGMGRG